MEHSGGILAYLYLLHFSKHTVHCLIYSIKCISIFSKILQNKTSHSQKDRSCWNLFKLWKSHACLKFSHYCYADVFLLPPTCWITCKLFFSLRHSRYMVQAFIKHTILPLHIFVWKGIFTGSHAKDVAYAWVRFVRISFCRICQQICCFYCTLRNIFIHGSQPC